MLDETMQGTPASVGDPDPSAPSVVFYGVAGTLLVIVVVLALEVLYHATAGREDERKNAAVAVELDAALEAQRARLVGYEWVDEANGIVSIPIERAMELVAEESGGSR